MRIGVAATPNVAIPTLNWLLESGHELVRVITQPDRPAGRGRELKQSEVALWANQHSIPFVKPANANELLPYVADLDLLLTIAYGVLLPQFILDAPKYGCVNMHFSLLPNYRGAAPVQRALLAGEVRTGVTIFKLDSGMDTGPIYATQTVDIDPAWRSLELLSELSLIGKQLLPQVLQSILSGQSPVAQTGIGTLAKKISKADAQIDWNSSATFILNSIRAFFPEPCAWTNFRGEVLKVSKVSLTQARLPLEPGELKTLDSLCYIGTGKGALVIESVIPSGKREMSAMDWSRGARFLDKERCG
jgi:methionyl-tRNA formyltransferase